MIETPRPESPQCLKENYKKWGKEYKANLEINPNYSFHWHNRRDLIDDTLFLMTANHCSFCDIQPLKASGPTIEHFRPKNKSPLLSYYWGNLFYCCSNCQKKGTRFSKKLLKPDQVSYKFLDYFIYNYSTGMIKPNPARNSFDQERADLTIELYGLNDWGRPDERIKERQKFLDASNPNINDYSYRFILH